MGTTSYTLGINTSFAVKRWPEPERWATVIEDLEVDLVQHTFDLVHLDGPAEYIAHQAAAVRAACEGHGLHLHSTFTGLAAYSSNLLLHPDEHVHASRGLVSARHRFHCPGRSRLHGWSHRCVQPLRLA